jgi:alpha-ribazole phosphatase
MRLWLVRHAQPLIASGVCYGQLDIAADSPATQQAAQALKNAVHAAPQKILVYVSALQRAQQLANEFAHLNPALNIITDPRLNEMDFGTWEGRAWSDIPPDAVNQWTADFAHHRFGGKESAREVIQRVAQAYEQTTTTAQQQDITDLIWITHAGVIRALEFYLQTGLVEIQQASDWPTIAPKFGEWIVKEIA